MQINSAIRTLLNDSLIPNKYFYLEQLLRISDDYRSKVCLAYLYLGRDELNKADSIIQIINASDSSTASKGLLSLTLKKEYLGVDWPEVFKNPVDSTYIIELATDVNKGGSSNAQALSVYYCRKGVYNLIEGTSLTSNRISINDTLTAINGVNSEKKLFNLYPNPSSGDLSVVLTKTDESPIQFEVRDVKFNSLVFKKELNGETEFNLTLPEIAAGVYVAKIKFRSQPDLIKLFTVVK
jgi:hypothetical protein